MFDERAERDFLARLESADPEAFRKQLTGPTPDEEVSLRLHLGDRRYQRLRGLALKAMSGKPATKPKGNVVVIPGLMGSQLMAQVEGSDSTVAWLDLPGLVTGGLARLRLAEDGREDFTAGLRIEATGIMKRYYGELLLSLARDWRVLPFWYDWRKEVHLAAADLLAKVDRWFGVDEPVHLVAHGLGGLVARVFIRRYPDRWAAMDDPKADTGGARGGRLIQLGPVVHGSFMSTLLLTGTGPLVRKLASIDRGRRVDGIAKIIGSFPSTYQILPDEARLAEVGVGLAGRIYDFETYGRSGVSRRHLELARKFHAETGDPTEDEAKRMVNVLGVGSLTPASIRDLGAIREPADDEAAIRATYANFRWTLQGDGMVPLALAWSPRVPTYVVKEGHASLATSPAVISALDELLRVGRSSSLEPFEAATIADVIRDDAEQPPPEAHDDPVIVGDPTARGGPPNDANAPSPASREAEEDLVRDVLMTRERSWGPARPSARAREPATIEIALAYDRIEKIDPWGLGRSPEGTVDRPIDPVDAIAVGHYLGVQPRKSEKDLDEAITGFLDLATGHGKLDRGGSTGYRGLLREYSDRGIIRGDLGQPFLLADPRAEDVAEKLMAADPSLKPEQARAIRGRVIAIAGMGVPGRFGSPELAVLARELCWSLGRIGKRHLAVVLVGGGSGAASLETVLSAWFQGIAQALSGASKDQHYGLKRITFVEDDPIKLRDSRKAILAAREKAGATGGLLVSYRGLYPDDPGNPAASGEIAEPFRTQLRDEAKRRHDQAWEDGWRRGLVPGPGDDASPTRITVSLDRRIYRFGAVTGQASIPEREIPLDPELVRRANAELAAQGDLAEQYERGRFLEGLLIPSDLRPELNTGAPLVLMLDSTTARIHWEMVAQTVIGVPGPDASPGGSSKFADYEEHFLGTSRSLTRQLRTTFAPPPEPPPPTSRLLRVLVVADPAVDAHLPGAELEGVEVADLFDAFNDHARRLGIGDGVEVVRLFGPSEATRTNVLRHIMLHSYDVLHYAGHCAYDEADPTASGWIFSNGERISINEMRRIDHIPRFIFSNACQSGITPDRSQLRDDRLAPSFAESFFERGVSNFVCTAWPVQDSAARKFALMLYSGLLGLELGADGRTYEPTKPRPAYLPMHLAMKAARRALAGTIGGKTWGAYQHYGNPYFQLFATLPTPPEPDPDDRGSKPPVDAAVAAGPGLGVGAGPPVDTEPEPEPPPPPIGPDPARKPAGSPRKSKT